MGPNTRTPGPLVALLLRERIVAGQLPPGAELSEEALCAALGVSRNALCEAFTMLGNEQSITRIPNRGAFVSQPTADDIREM